MGTIWKKNKDRNQTYFNHARPLIKKYVIKNTPDTEVSALFVKIVLSSTQTDTGLIK